MFQRIWKLFINTEFNGQSPADVHWACTQLTEKGVVLAQAPEQDAKHPIPHVCPYLDKTLSLYVEPIFGTPLNTNQVKFESRLGEIFDFVKNHIPARRWPDFLGDIVSIARIGFQHNDLNDANEQLSALKDSATQCASDLIHAYRIRVMLWPSMVLTAALALALFFLPDHIRYYMLYAEQNIKTTAVLIVGMGGVLGCLISVILRSGREIADIRVERELLCWMTRLRPFIAAIITIIAYLYVRTGVFVKVNMNLADPLITFLVGFLLGFNERFYTENFLSEAVTRLGTFGKKK
jgi:hypothetical protein